MEFKNKVCLITGSSQGIGKALALKLGRAGAIVVLNGRNEQRLEKAVAELREMDLQVAGLPGDVTNAGTCQRLVEKTLRLFGRLDVLVNNAGISVGPGSVEEVRPEVFEQVVSTNYLSAVYVTRAALAALRKAKGAVLFVSSIAGLIGFPDNAAYCAGKMPLTAFAESLRWETRGSGVHVGIAYVGHTENEKGKRILAPAGGTMLKEHIYPVRLMPIEEVAGKLFKMLERRTFKAYLPFSARVLVNINHYFPSLFRFLFAQFLRRQTPKRSTGIQDVQMRKAG